MFPTLRLDWVSFILGIVAGSLFWFLFLKLRPSFYRFRSSLEETGEQATQERRERIEILLANDTLRLAQKMHLAAPLFALDEILIPPRLLAPPFPPDLELSGAHEDITDWILPYMPDWPELASAYRAPTLKLAQALEGGCHLALIGPPGSGKTVALAYLATQIIRQDPECEGLAGRVPIIIHIADLTIKKNDASNTLEPIIQAVCNYSSPSTVKRLSGFLSNVFQSGRALLLLDGLDELPQSMWQTQVDYIRELLANYPTSKIVTTGSLEYLDGLQALDFVPLALMPWTDVQRTAFLQQWGKLWSKFIPQTTNSSDSEQALLLSGWLRTIISPGTPLEVCLQAWAAYAGDSLGPTINDAIEAYVRRMSAISRAHDQQDSRLALERAAYQMTTRMQPVITRDTLESWLSERPNLSGGLSGLIENGLMISHPENRLAFNHSVIAGYLAGRWVAAKPEALSERVGEICAQPGWAGRTLALKYIASLDRNAIWMDALCADESVDPLLSGYLMAARWLPGAPGDFEWRTRLLRQLAQLLQNQTLSDGLNARLISALITSGSTGINILMQQLINTGRESMRALVALACGYLRDQKVLNELIAQSNAPSPNLNRSACLALAALGSQDALDRLSDILMMGNEDQRRFAAEALANHPELGQPILIQESTSKSVATRRATVFGLGRVQQPWAMEAVEKILLEDEQWAVKNAATQVTEALAQPGLRSPKRLPVLTEAPWLIAFAGREGIGVAPGKPAMDLLLKALRDGELEERLIAMQYLPRYGNEGSILPLYQAYFTGYAEIREAALIALWHLGLSGISLPSPHGLVG